MIFSLSYLHILGEHLSMLNLTVLSIVKLLMVLFLYKFRPMVEICLRWCECGEPTVAPLVTKFIKYKFCTLKGFPWERPCLMKR